MKRIISTQMLFAAQTLSSRSLFNIWFSRYFLQEEGVWPRPPSQRCHGDGVLRWTGAQALHHRVSGASPLQHLQVRRASLPMQQHNKHNKHGKHGKHNKRNKRIKCIKLAAQQAEVDTHRWCWLNRSFRRSVHARTAVETVSKLCSDETVIRCLFDEEVNIALHV